MFGGKILGILLLSTTIKLYHLSNPFIFHYINAQRIYENIFLELVIHHSLVIDLRPDGVG